MNFLSSKEAAQKIGISHKTLANWRTIGKGPYFIKVGWAILYPPDSVDKFIKERNDGYSTT